MANTHLRTKDADVDQRNTHQWLRGAETKGFTMAAQDQSLFIRND